MNGRTQRHYATRRSNHMNRQYLGDDVATIVLGASNDVRG